jgi:hypothetical protein
MRVLAFDIGIKNLAFCVLDGSQVIALENCNILPPVEPVHCSQCKVRAKYSVQDKVWCKKHIPKTHKILPELMGKKLPPNKILKELVKTHECVPKGHYNSDYLDALATKFAMKYEQPKQINASKVSLEIVHDALRFFVSVHWHVFTECTHVLLENQPVFKNPHMKSVQVLLFAVLREIFLTHEETPAYHFVHAKKKTQKETNDPQELEPQAGDAGYADRKAKSEERLTRLFETGAVVNKEIYEAWKKSPKKSDMADALCMTVDYMTSK